MSSAIDDLPPPPSASSGIDDLPPPPSPSGVEALGRGAVQGATLGFGDELSGLGGAAGTMAGQATGQGSLIQARDPALQAKLDAIAGAPQTFGGAYRQTRDEARATNEAARAAHPYLYGGAEMAGSILPMAAGGIAAKAAGVTAGPVATSAALGAAMGAGGSNADLTKGDVGQAAIDTGIGGAVGAAIPPLADAAGAAAKKVAQGAGWAGTKLLSSLGGVKPAVIQEYLPFSERINAAPTQEALKDISDQFVGKLSSDVDAKKLTLDQASDAFKGFQSDLKDAYKTAGYDARDAVTSAQDTLKDAHNARIQALSSDIYDTVNRLKSAVQSGSQNALDLLDSSDATRNSAKGINPFVDLTPIQSQIDATMAQLQKAGTDESLSVADKLQAYKDRLTEMGGRAGEIPATDAKKLIQGIDKITKYSPMAGAFDDVKNAAFKDIRSTFDQTLKDQVPVYRAAMIPVAKDTDLLSRVSDFGDKQTAAGILGRINAPNQLERKAALQELGQKYGTDFVAAAQPENLPEQAILNRAQAAQESLRPDRVAGKIDQKLASSRQQSALNDARTGYQNAQDALAPFKSLAPNAAGQTQAQAKLAQVGKNIEVTRMFSDLGKLTDTDFIQAMHDQGIQAAFQKGAYNGSRNTLFGSIIGSIAGTALGGGGFGLASGAAAGASWGRMVDQWGPMLTKRVLDGVIRVSRSPAMGTISELELPAPIKRSMAIGLQDYLSSGQAARIPASSSPSAQAAPQTGPSWQAMGIQNLGITDPGTVQRILADPKALDLVHAASSYKPGSKALQGIQTQLKKWSSP